MQDSTKPSAVAQETILDLRREFVCEALDLAQCRMVWATRHLQERRDKETLVAFDAFIMAARAAKSEVEIIRAAAK